MKYQNKFNDGMNDANGCRPSLTFYHSNAKCSGGALNVILHPATENDDGYLELRFADQISVGDNDSPPAFDWDNYREVYLDFNAVAKMLQVFRGECESIDDGKGVHIMRYSGASLRFNVTHMLEPVRGYVMKLVYHPANSDKCPEDKHYILLYPYEALGLCEAIAVSLGLIAFGRPKLINV